MNQGVTRETAKATPDSKVSGEGEEGVPEEEEKGGISVLSPLPG